MLQDPGPAPHSSLDDTQIHFYFTERSKNSRPDWSLNGLSYWPLTSRVKYTLEEDHLHTWGMTLGLAPGTRISEYHDPLSNTSREHFYFDQGLTKDGEDS